MYEFNGGDGDMGCGLIGGMKSGWVEWYQERGQNRWCDGRWSVVMWQVRIIPIRFGSYDTGGEIMTATKQEKDN